MAYPLKGSNSSDVATLDFAMLGNARQLKANKQVDIDFWNQSLILTVFIIRTKIFS